MRRGKATGAAAAVAAAACLVMAPIPACKKAAPIAETKKQASAPTRKQMAQLSALPYLSNYPQQDSDQNKMGLVLHKTKQAYRGVTVYGTWENRAYFIDMEGSLLHELRFDLPKVQGVMWMRIARDGSFFLLGLDGLARVDSDSKILWQADDRYYHHDFDLDEAGRLYALSKALRPISYSGQTVHIFDEFITIFSPEGKLEKEISIYDLAGHRLYSSILDKLAMRQKHWNFKDAKDIENKISSDWQESRSSKNLYIDNPYDLFHINTVKVVGPGHTFAKKGHLLICLRNLDLVLVIDPNKKKIVWEWREGIAYLDRPHAPMLRGSDRLLLFDNGWRRGYSKIVEVNTLSKKIVWQYEATPPESFFSKRGAMAQHLPNGNVLITESAKGHIFEITREGQIVWDFWNPRIYAHNGKRNVYRAWRMLPEDLKRLKTDGTLTRKLRAKGYL